MITEDKINQMYESAIECTRLTTQELKELGFNQHDLTNLVQQGRLIRIKKGQYEVIAKDLHDYGKSLLKSGKFEEAYRCYLLFYHLNIQNFQIFLQNI